MSEILSIRGAQQNKRHALKDHRNDLYETPPEAVTALLRSQELPAVIWEPACGPGSIVRVLRASGRQVYATDLINYDSPDQDESSWDFLMEKQLPIGVEAIVTNPPYALAGQFATHALMLCPIVVMLLRLGFLESEGRSAILDGGRLAKVLPFRDRLPMMHRDGWQGKKSTNTMAFAWFVWKRDWNKLPEIQRISWRREG